MTAESSRTPGHTMRHGGARTMGLGGNTADFSTSVNPLGMHPAALRAIRAAAAEAADYPDADARALEEAAASYLGVPAEAVVAGNGATEIIHNVCRHTAGRQTMVPDPGFGEYAAAAKACGSPVSSYAASPNGTPHDMPRNCCVFVCNPSSPAGRLMPKDAILEAAAAARDADSLLIVDECFIEMTPGRDESVASRAGLHPGMVVLRSLTKSFGMAGLRAGYCVADPNLASRLREIRMPWSVNALAQAAGVEALARPEYLESTRAAIRRGVDGLQRAMRDMRGIQPHRTDANYFVARTEDPAPAVVGRLLKRNVLVRDCTSFGMGHHIRIATKSPAKNEILLEALRESCRA